MYVYIYKHICNIGMCICIYKHISNIGMYIFEYMDGRRIEPCEDCSCPLINGLGVEYNWIMRRTLFLCGWFCHSSSSSSSSYLLLLLLFLVFFSPSSSNASSSSSSSSSPEFIRLPPSFPFLCTAMEKDRFT